MQSSILVNLSKQTLVVYNLISKTCYKKLSVY
jgi:hypothetical protein